MSMLNTVDWIGRVIADGRYEILSRLDEGSMGLVYRAYDRRLETDVVIKFPSISALALNSPELLARFGTEIRSLVRLSHPHVVKILDVGEIEGLPYVVMQYLAGGSLKARMESGEGGRAQPMSVESLKSWLPAVAGALDFLHGENHVHRDVKPGNILFDQHNNAFLGDFGLIKVLTGGDAPRREGSMTAAGVLLGTPNYVAPEVVMGREYDGRADQYSLAMTVHEVLAGKNVMEGPTPSATMVNHTNIDAPPLIELASSIPVRLSDAVQRALSKDPQLRFDDCSTFASEVIAAFALPKSRPARMASDLGASHEVISRRANCPHCNALIPVEPRLNGKRGRCGQCGALSLIEINYEGVALKLVAAPKAEPEIPWEEPELPAVRPAAAATPRAKPTSKAAKTAGPIDRATRPNAPPPERKTIAATSKQIPPSRSEQRISPARLIGGGVLLVALTSALVWAVLALRGRGTERTPVQGAAASTPAATAPIVTAAKQAPVPSTAQPVEINIAYGTEKKKWLEAVLASFQKTPAGRRIKVNLHGLGSVEGAQAVLDGPKPTPIHVWSPASSAYRDVFEHEWRIRHSGNVIVKAENLAMTPMVFLMWKQRYEPFIKKYGKVSFKTLGMAMREPGGWGTIAGKPEWGLFKFSHTHPLKSNSGMLCLVMMAYEYTGKERGLDVSDITDSAFQAWMRGFESSLARPGGAGTLANSTGNQMREMVLRGPSQYDCLLLYENLAIDYLQEARDRWGELQVVYPEPSMWNENPYYILDVPWSDDRKRAAAEEFLVFLMSESSQSRALVHGFRPGNTAVPIKSLDSPLIKHESFGLRLEVPRMCEPPRAEVVNDLLTSFRRLEP
jgi:serine/threonine-protein kinase